MKRIVVYLLIVVAFILRIGLMFQAHHGDLNNNISWGNETLIRGFNGFYEGKDWPYSAPNQPPLYILLFSLTSFIYNTITDVSWELNSKAAFFPSTFIWTWQQYGMDFLVKMPAILCDFAIACVLYKYFAKKNKREMGIKVSLLWLFNPVIWYNSSLWGQTDAIVNLLGLIAVVSLLNKDLVKTCLFFSLAFLFKGSLMLFAPIILIVAILQKHGLSSWVKAIVVGLFAVLVISIWFHPNFDLPIWLINLYTNRFFPGEIGSLTANAFNFWWLVDAGKTLDSTLFFGTPARTWGIIVMVLTLITVAFSIAKKTSDQKIITNIAVIALVAFLFMTRIHERYLYPFFPYATLLVGFNPIWLIPLTIFSLSNLINLYNLFWAPPIPFLEKALAETSLPNVLAVVNLAVFLFVLLIWRKSNYN